MVDNSVYAAAENNSLDEIIGRLVDELRLMVFPVVVGKGKRLFEDGEDGRTLKLVDSKTFGTGVVSLAYRPERS
jgi:dihydrofolate reductase